jgi:2-polyprenyl-6-methoxyphenol hydroxylase-like FAD-dependent oxidoreductase
LQYLPVITAEPLVTTSVLIVGAGPVGLTAALELTRFGVPVRIVDKAPAPATTSKALAVWPRTLEMLNAAGVSADLIAAGVRAHGNRIFNGDKLLVELSFDTLASPYPFLLLVTQDRTEAILTAHLEQLGIAVERAVEVTSIDQDQNAVSASLRHSDGTTETAEAAWLIGCDGAHSFLRHALGKSFDGSTNPADFILADLYLTSDPPLSHSAMSMFAHRDGILAIFPIGKERFRIIADLGAPSPDVHRAEPTLADVQAVLDTRGPGGLTAHDPVWLSAFRINERQVDSYRSERMFLAGDAAHVHSPAGGQGMNTGMQDACNLAWKLALLARDEASGDMLLESYNTERHPVAKAVIAQTTALTATMTVQNPVMQSIRNTAMYALFEIPAVEHTAANVLSEISIGYPKSALSDGTHALHNGPQAGARAPIGETYASQADGSTLPRFLLYCDEDAEARRFVADYPFVVDATVYAPFVAGGLWLVRPDGYVGLATRAGDWDVARSYLERIGCDKRPPA